MANLFSLISRSLSYKKAIEIYKWNLAMRDKYELEIFNIGFTVCKMGSLYIIFIIDPYITRTEKLPNFEH